MASLDHPNLVRLKEALEDEVSKKIYLVMEYCSRGAILSNTFWLNHKSQKNNLLEEVSQDKPKDENRLTLYQAKRYLIHILQGLDYRRLLSYLVHNERGIVHHDIKPENILVDTHDVAKITDFGISVQLDENQDDEVMNHDWGTKLYLPPESWAKQKMIGKAKDVWALGCTFYQLVYNKFPFVNSIHIADTKKSILNDQ